ncbi:MAG: hypothetical protein FRX49_08162 [Trebouxia sp. A1-2]|nr:MAG: hypothetical protein FRX49_08162 [Trebouxia sp. A1-2]
MLPRGEKLSCWRSAATVVDADKLPTQFASVCSYSAILHPDPDLDLDFFLTRWRILWMKAQIKVLGVVQTSLLAEQGNAMHDSDTCLEFMYMQSSATSHTQSLVILPGQGRLEMAADLEGASSQRNSGGNVTIQVQAQVAIAAQQIGIRQLLKDSCRQQFERVARQLVCI